MAINAISRRKRNLYALLNDSLVVKATWRIAKCLSTLRSQANELWPNRNKSSDGTIGDTAHQGRESDHNPWVKDGDVGVITAMDLTHDPKHGCDAERVVDALLLSKEARSKYIIWNRRIVSSEVAPWMWRHYAGSNPHNEHVNLAGSAQKLLYDDDSHRSISAERTSDIQWLVNQVSQCQSGRPTTVN